MIAPNPDHALPEESNADSQPATPRRRARTGPLLLGAVLGLFAALAGFFAYVALTRPHLPRLTEADYEAALARWEKNGPADYDLDLELTGNRPGKIHVEVRGGEVTHMTRDGVEPRQRRTWDVWSVPGQFDTIGQELEMARHPAKAFANAGAAQMVMWAKFDPRLAYPVQYDRVVLGADFEVHWKVTDFRDLSAKN